MLKLLLVSATLMPILTLPLWQAKASASGNTSAQAETVERVSENIDTCQDADVSIYFHDLAVTTHSAKYIFESVSSASTCPSVEFEIIPLIPKGADDDEIKMSMDQAKELQQYMALTGYAADISATVNEESNSDDSWRAAILRIKTASAKKT
ncbi:MAG: hypothetical protein ACSHXY_02020 [Alphaproteobacteria bacterium]